MADQGNSFFSGTQDISQLVNGVNGVLSTLHLTNDAAIYPKIAFVDNGATTNGTPIGRSIAGVENGDGGQAGERMNYPMSPVSNAPEKWPFGLPREAKDIMIVNSVVDRQRAYVPTERIYLDKQDPYQILSGKQGQIISRAGRAMDFDFIDLVNGNTSATYDGLTFFNTARPVMPGSGITFSNDVTCTVAQWLSGDGMAILLETLANIPWFDGQLKDGAMSKPLILCPSMTTAFKARQLVGINASLPGGAAPIIAQAIDAGGGKFGVGSGSSPFNGMVSDVVHFQDLVSPIKYPNSARYVYAIANMGSSVQPAFIVSPKRYPYMNVYGMSPDDEIRRVFGAIGWDWDGYWGVGYGLPQCVVRMLING